MAKNLPAIQETQVQSQGQEDPVEKQITTHFSSLGWNTGVGSLYHLKGLFPTQESNPGLLNCRQILYQLSYEGSPWQKAKRN